MTLVVEYEQKRYKQSVSERSLGVRRIQLVSIWPQSILSSFVSNAFIIVRLIVWFYGFPTGYAHFPLRLQCALFPFDASSQKPLSPFLP